MFQNLRVDHVIADHGKLAAESGRYSLQGVLDVFRKRFPKRI
jgi:hypothetical protein